MGLEDVHFSCSSPWLSSRRLAGVIGALGARNSSSIVNVHHRCVVNTPVRTSRVSSLVQSSPVHLRIVAAQLEILEGT